MIVPIFVFTFQFFIYLGIIGYVPRVKKIIIRDGSYVDTAATGAGLVADQAADRKTAKYANLRAQYVFQPVSVEKLGPFSSSTLEFLRDLGRRISHISGDDREVLFLFQRISVTI